MVTKGESGLGGGWVPGGRRCEGQALKKGPRGGRGKINKNRVSSEFSAATKKKMKFNFRTH